MGSNVSYDVSLLGDEALTRVIRSLQKGAANRVMRPSLRLAAKGVMKTAASTAPRGATLKTSTTLKLKASSRRGTISVRVQTGSREAMGIEKVAKYYYPSAKELGTDDMVAQPWLRPALETNRAAAFATIRTEAWRRIEMLGLGRQPSSDGGD